jgi:hypothetical protein
MRGENIQANTNGKKGLAHYLGGLVVGSQLFITQCSKLKRLNVAQIKRQTESKFHQLW